MQSMNQQFIQYNFPSIHLQCVLIFLDNPLAQSIAFYVNLYMNGTFKLTGPYYFFTRMIKN